ncbi:hypothetical protein [Natronorubrum sp. DTA7]|uniref:hypothetical protein n=1 Tax=Natronorubrum sp. DTA7 TaxID=3447016 RepID=UPI003F872344
MGTPERTTIGSETDAQIGVDVGGTFSDVALSLEERQPTRRTANVTFDGHVP